jgi:hypothetical protein
MKIFVLLLLLSFNAMAQMPLLDIKSLTDTLSQVSEDQKLMNVRLFLKTSGDQWEKVQSCGGVGLARDNWYSQLRMSDLSRTPKNADEALALRLARESLIASVQGNIQRREELLQTINSLGVKLSACGLDYSSITSDVLATLFKARIQLGSELRKTFLNVNKSARQQIFSHLIDCQRGFAEGTDANLDCYRNLMQHVESAQQEHALNLVKESAILTLLIERNQNPPCVRLPELSTDENDDWQVGSFMSPLFDMNKEQLLNAHLMACRLGTR